MSTSIQSNINIPSSSIQLNTPDYVNKGINDIIVDYFHYLNPNKQKTISNLAIGIGILITSDMIKSIIQNLIRDNTKNINEGIISTIYLSFDGFCYFGKALWNHAVHAKNKMFLLFKKDKLPSFEHQNCVKNDDSIIYSVTIKAHDIFVKNLIHLLENYHTQKANIYQNISNISFNEKLSNNITINDSYINLEKQLYNISIQYEELTIDITSLTYCHSSNNEIIIKEKQQKQNLLFELLSKKYKQYEDIYQRVYKEYNIDIISKKKYYELSIKHKEDPKKSLSDPSYTFIYKPIPPRNSINVLNISCFIIYYLIDEIYELYINKKIDSMSMSILFSNIVIYETYLACYSSNEIISIALSHYKKHYYIVPWSDNLIPILKKLEISKSFTKKDCGTKDDAFLKNIKIYLRRTSKQQLIMDDDDNDNDNDNDDDNNNDNDNDDDNNNNSNTNNNVLECYLSSTSINNKKSIYEKFNEFVNYVNIMSKRHNINKKVNIYTINVEINTVTSSKLNEEYDEYMETKKKLIEEKKSTEDIIKLIGVEPKKTIITENLEKEVKTQVVNSKYCAFNNLYLRQEQDKKLYDLVNTFQNDKQLMQELGIPNKLGILLHGEPGCGKTTTIITIASYFGRDIFYINLKLIKKNEDLKLVFDYINSKHSRGGIIVLEDIDAMTNVVKKRSVSKEIAITDLLGTNENEITLEYMLNLLDGTLTFDDSIVIMTTNHLEYLDPALYRPGRIDKIIEMKKCDHYQISRIFKKFIQRDIQDEVLNRIPDDTFTPAQVIFHLVSWIKCRDEPDETIMREFIN
jgi:ATP-dependent 26S proteasome regulatory subunit